MAQQSMNHVQVVVRSRFPKRPDSDDLWSEALESLSDEDRSLLKAQGSNKLEFLSELQELTCKEIQRAKQGGFSFKRRNGQTVNTKDLLSKVVKWIDHFKQVGDVAVQYDPIHASLPWAGVRFLLDIATSDLKAREFILEHAAIIAELICRYAVFEDLLLRFNSTPAVDSELRRALTDLYAKVLLYLAKAKAYFQDGKLNRSIKNTLLLNPDLESHFNEVESAQVTVDRYQIERHSDLKNLLGDIETPLVRSASTIAEIKDDLDVAKRTRILQWISGEPYEKHHKQTKTDVLQGTGKWLLTDPTYIGWKKDSASSILWLHGIPGSGKSKLVSIVIEDAMEGYRNGMNPEPVYFYCSRNPAEPGRSNSRDIVASLLRQLARVSSKSGLLEPITKAYREEEASGFSGGSLDMDECRSLIMELLPQHSTVTVVIDALDECNAGMRDQLLETLEHILQDSPTLVKIFVSSRDDQDIVCHLENYPSLELSSARNSGDINSYLNSETERLIRRRLLLRNSARRDELKSLIISELSEGARGMFRWVALQLQALCDLKTDQAIRERIGKLPAKLEDLYQELLDKIEQSPSQADRQYARNTLSWVLSAQRTLTIEEFLVAVSKSIGLSADILTKEHVLSLCSNMVVFDETLDTFRFAHLSVREFLENHSDYAQEVIHSMSAELCLLCLIAGPDAAYTWSFLEQWGYAMPDLASFAIMYHYATLYWGSHCHLSRDKRLDGNLKRLLSFFLSNEGEARSPFRAWEDLLYLLLRSRLYEKTLTSRLEGCLGERPSSILVACCFDLSEVLQTAKDTSDPALVVSRNRAGRTPLEIAVVNASWGCIEVLLSGAGIQSNKSDLLDAAGGISRDNALTEYRSNYGGPDALAMERALEAATSNDREGLELLKFLIKHHANRLRVNDRVLKAAIGNSGPCKEILDLLVAQFGDQLGPHITESVIWVAAQNKEAVATVLRLAGIDKAGKFMLYAASNHQDGDEVMASLLEVAENVAITKDIILMACRNPGCGKQILELLLRLRGDQIQVTERMMKEAVGNMKQAVEIIQLLIDHYGDQVPITEDIITRTVTRYHGRATDLPALNLLLDRYRGPFEPTEDMLLTAAGSFEGPTLIHTLLGSSTIPSGIIEEVTIALMSRIRDVQQVVKFLRVNDVRITEGILIAAASRYDHGDLMNMLLKRKGQDVQITKNILISASSNVFFEPRHLKHLLKEIKDLTLITEEVILAAAGNIYYGHKVMEQLLDLIPITPFGNQVMLAAAQNTRKGLQIITLIHSRGKLPRITEDMVEAACRNPDQGFEILRWLFDNVGDKITVTEKMLRVAAGQKRHILSLLLDHGRIEGEVPEGILNAAATSSSGTGAMELLLERYEDQVYINNQILVETVRFWGWETNQMISLLFDCFHDAIWITEDILSLAASNRFEKGLSDLLSYINDPHQITGNIMRKFAREQSKEDVQLLMEKNGHKLEIDSDLIAAASGNRRSGVEIVRFLVDRLCSEGRTVPITTAIIQSASANIGDDGEQILRLLIDMNKSQVACSITETAVLSAARFGHTGILDVFRNELGFKVEDKYFLIAALHNACWSEGYADVRRLLAQGVDPDHPGRSGWTPLAIAARRGYRGIVDMLLKTGSVDVNSRDKKGRTPLFHAVRGKHYGNVRLLLQSKASVDIRERGGKTLEDRAGDWLPMFRYLKSVYSSSQ